MRPSYEPGRYRKSGKVVPETLQASGKTMRPPCFPYRDTPGRYALAYATRHLPYPNHVRSYLDTFEGLQDMVAVHLHSVDPRHSCACLAMQVAGHLFEGRGSGSYCQYLLLLSLHVSS